jgi:hypothetical protein
MVDRRRSARPNRLQQVVPTDDALAILDQMQQEVEDLRPDRNPLGSPVQLAAVGVEQIVFEQEWHGRRSLRSSH